MKNLDIAGASFWICVAICVHSFSSCAVREFEIKHDRKMVELKKECGE